MMIGVGKISVVAVAALFFFATTACSTATERQAGPSSADSRSTLPPADTTLTEPDGSGSPSTTTSDRPISGAGSPVDHEAAGSDSIAFSAHSESFGSTDDLIAAADGVITGVASDELVVLECNDDSATCIYEQHVLVTQALKQFDAPISDRVSVLFVAPDFENPLVALASEKGNLYVDKYHASPIAPGEEYVLPLKYAAGRWAAEERFVQVVPGQSLLVGSNGELAQDQTVDWAVLREVFGSRFGVDIVPSVGSDQSAPLVDAPKSLAELSTAIEASEP